MIRERQEVPQNERWNVEALYPALTDWKKEFDSVQGKEGPARIGRNLKAFEGKLKDPGCAGAFFRCLFQIWTASLSKLYTYAHLRLDEDLGNDEFKQNLGQITSLIHDFQLEYSWVEPELLAMSEKDFNSSQGSCRSCKTIVFIWKNSAGCVPTFFPGSSNRCSP